MTTASKSVIDTENDPETEPDSCTERDRDYKPKLANETFSESEEDDHELKQETRTQT